MIGAGWFVDHVIVKEGSYEQIKAIDEQKHKEKENDKNIHNTEASKGKQDDKKTKGKDKDSIGKNKKDDPKAKGTDSEDKEKEDKAGYRIWFFACSRWFDEGMDDKCIERILTPGPLPLEEFIEEVQEQQEEQKQEPKEEEEEPPKGNISL